MTDNRWLRSLVQHNVRQAERSGNTVLAAQMRTQVASLRPLRYRQKVRPVYRTLAPRGVRSSRDMMVVPRPVIGLDLDGTLGDFHRHFLTFAEGYLQRQVRWHWDGTEPFWRMLGVSKRTYREVKLAYRQGGLKRSMPLIPGAKDLVNGLRREGAEVWLCTTRPYLRLDNIDPDTRFWLRHHRLGYDGVLFGERKYRDLALMVGCTRVLGILDDLPEMVDSANANNLNGTLIERTYNRHTDLPSVPSLSAASLMFHGLITTWRKENNVRP